MYNLIKFLEKCILNFNCFIKIGYYKLKYGKSFKCGKKVKFRKRFNLNINDGGFVSIGDNCFFNNDCSINCRKKIVIGSNNLFGENVKIYDHNHVFNDKSINWKKEFKKREILIGNNNFFGSNCVILSKTEIGSYNVFSANQIINTQYGSEEIINFKLEKEIKKIKFKRGSSNNE